MSYDTKISHPIGGKLVQGGLPTSVLNTLQFNAVTNQWEFVGAVAASLSDLEFLRDKSLAGDLITVNGTTGAVAPVTVLSIIPAINKTFFIVSHTFTMNNRTTTDVINLKLQNDGVDKDDVVIQHLAQATTVIEGKRIVGDLLIGDGVRAYRIQKSTGAVNHIAMGTVMGWIQDT